jgi:biotin transport system substrate-specific component
MRIARDTLVQSVWPAGGLARDLLVVLAGSGLLAASAWIKVPMWPVPMTMQTFAVLLIAGACGARLGVATIAAYLVQAALGLPVLAGQLPLMAAGPTTGYLAGHLLAAAAVGWLADRGWTRRWDTLLAALLLGELLIMAPGLAWLYGAFLHDWNRTLAAGLTPFLLGDGLKLLLAASVLAGLHRLRARG